MTFVLLRLAPGGPFDRERKLPPEVLANIETKYHLGEPLAAQYLRYLWGIVRGDFGPSYKYVDRPVSAIIADTLPTSALLGAAALVLALLLSLPAGLLAAYQRRRWLDRGAMLLATLGLSVPHFILGALLIWVVALKLGWLQAGRWDHWSSAMSCWRPSGAYGSRLRDVMACRARSTNAATGTVPRSPCL